MSVLLTAKCFAYDQDLADRLKEDLEHESNRRKAFREYEDEKKKSEKEQNRGLSLWLEEQEQWDASREKAVFEYKKEKRPTPQEGSPEYLADQAEKARLERVVEEGRKQHVAIKNKILAQFQPLNHTSEEEELGMNNTRPRYDLRKRGRNKWTNKGGAGFGGGSSPGSQGAGFQNDGSFDFPPPPPPDFNTMPQDGGFDDFPPPPPPPADFGNAPGTFDSGFGDAPIPPPPPPPPDGGWDF